MIRRLIAYCIDWYIMSFVMNVFLVMIYYFQTHTILTNLIPIQAFPIKSQCTLLLGLFVIFILYDCILPYFWNGQTIGKKISKIRIVSEKKWNLWTLFLRNFIGFVLIEGCFNPFSNYIRNVLISFAGRDIVQYLVYFSVIAGIVSIGCMFISPKRKMLHDYIANTKVDLV